MRALITMMGFRFITCPCAKLQLVNNLDILIISLLQAGLISKDPTEEFYRYLTIWRNVKFLYFPSLFMLLKTANDYLREV